MKFSSFFSKLTIGIVVLILISVGSFYWIYQSNSSLLRLGGVKNNPEATKFISKQAPLMVSLLINPENLTAFSKLVSDGEERRQIRREIEQIRDNILAKTKLNYEKDLQKWLGNEATLAVTSLDFDHDSSNGVQPGYLLAVKNKNSQLAKEFLQIYYSPEAISETSELIFDTYKGVNLIFQKPLVNTENVNKIATAVVGDFILFANDIQVLKEAINNVQAIDLNLANYTAYQDTLKTITEPKISLAYLNLPSFSAWISNSFKPENKIIQQTLTLSLAVNPHGLIAHSALFGVAGATNLSPSLTSPPATLNYISADSILAAVGINLNQFWQEISNGLPENSPLQQIINQAIIPIEKSLNINLVKDIFSQVKGQYALSLSSSPQTDKLDWVFVTENDDINFIENLDNLAKSQDLSVGNLPLFNTNITAWTKLITVSENNFSSLQAEVKGVHTNIDKYQILTNSVNVLSDTINKPENSLLNSEKFQQAITALPSKNNGYLYINWRKFEPIVAKKFPVIRVAELGFKPLFDKMRSLTITSEGTENGVRQATIFLRF